MLLPIIFLPGYAEFIPGKDVWRKQISSDLNVSAEHNSLLPPFKVKVLKLIKINLSHDVLMEILGVVPF